MHKLYKSYILLVFILIAQVSYSTTYYNRTGTRYCDTRTDWTTNAAGVAGASPGNFTTSGDIFNVRVSTVMGQFFSWTVGTGVTVNVYGELDNDFFSSMTFNGTLFVQNGGTLRIVSNFGGLTLGTLATFGATSNVIFEDAANLFDPKYNYGNLTFNDGFNDPSMGTTYRLRVQNDLTISALSANFLLSSTASFAHTIGRDFIISDATSTHTIIMDNGTGSPTLAIGRDLVFNAGSAASFRTNNGSSDVGTMTVTGNITMNRSSSTFSGTSYTGDVIVNVGGNINANASGAVHMSNDYGCTGCTIGTATFTIAGSIVVASTGHLDLAYNQKGSANTVYVSGSATVAVGGVFVGPHNQNKTDGLVPTLIFKDPGSLTAGNLSMTTGDYDGVGSGTADCNTGSGQFNVIIQNNRQITLLSDIELGTGRSFTVNAGGTLITGTSGGTAYTVKRKQNDGTTYATTTTFTLSPTSGGLYSEIDANATPNALMATATSGNVQTDTRNYDPTANYKFNATGSQSTGDFLTLAFNGNKVNKLIVNNTAGLVTTGLTLSSPVTITSDLTFIAGRLKTTSTNLPTVDVAGIASGYGSTSGNTAYVDGPLAKKTTSTSSFLFPTGNSAGALYRPIAFTPGNATATTYQTQLMNGSAGGSVLSNLSWYCPVFYWDTKTISGTAPVNANLYYINLDLALATIPLLNYYVTSAQYSYSGTSMWENTGSGGIDSISSLHNIKTSLQPVVSSGKYLAVAQAIRPLPIELLSFTGKEDGTRNIISWTTATEVNNAYFTLERSRDGKNFEAIARIKGKGNSSSLVNYSHIDPRPYNGASYYRLKQTDFDGTLTIYNVIMLRSVKKEEMKVSVVKSGEQAGLRIITEANGASYQVKVYDMTGSQVLVITGNVVSGSVIPLELSINHGAYIISYEQEGEDTVSQKIIL